MTKYVKCQYKERKREISAITMRKYCKIMLYLYCHLIRTAINALKRSLQLNSKNGSGIHSRFALEMRQRPTLPYSVPYSTIGSVQLNFRVRYENGWILHDIVTAMAYSLLAHRQRYPSGCAAFSAASATYFSPPSREISLDALWLSSGSPASPYKFHPNSFRKLHRICCFSLLPVSCNRSPRKL